MTSRKKNKGKERKAKKAEAAKLEAEKAEEVRNSWVGRARGDWEDSRGREFIQCDHGFTDLIPDHSNNVVCLFMDELFMNCLKEDMGKYLNVRDLFLGYNPLKWFDSRAFGMVIIILVSIGTNLLLHNDMSGPLCLAKVIVIIENYDERKNYDYDDIYNFDVVGDYNATINSPDVSTKMRALFVEGSSTNHDLLKFYRKRITCSCLKKMHLEMRKTLPKLGMCYHCEEEKERSLLMVCSRCKIGQYCSRECQIADWPYHKCACDVYFSAHDRHQTIHSLCEAVGSGVDVQEQGRGGGLGGDSALNDAVLQVVKTMGGEFYT